MRGLKEEGEGQEKRKSGEKRMSSSVKEPALAAAEPAAQAPPAKGFGLARAHTLAPGAFTGNAVLQDDAELSEDESG